MSQAKKFVLVLMAAVLGSHPSLLEAQGSASSPAASRPGLSPQELDQVVAPIALFPDSLLSQIFMASTYPLEVVQADRFAKANAGLKDDALTASLEEKNWDPSVKSLVNFPTVLNMMSENLESTVTLGDAFIADQKSVMDAVQRLRGQAQAQGNLQTTKEQTVIVERPPETQVTIIRIVPVNPKVIYVPVYNPVVVYGPWPYPTYVPYYYRPPGYVSVGVISYGSGFVVGASWGYAWGSCNWGQSNVKVNINQNVNINRNINRTQYQNQIQNPIARQNGQGTFEFNPAHRKGVPYRDQDTAQKFGGGAPAQAVQAREPFRGRPDAGGVQALPNRPSNGQPGGGITNRPGSGSPAGAIENRPGTGNPPGGIQNRPGGASPTPAIQNRPAAPAGGTRPPARGSGGAFDNVGNGGGAARFDSQQGSNSRGGGSGSNGSARPSGGRGR